MKRKLYWPAITFLYGYVAFRLLWHYAGPAADGSGYMPGLILPGFGPPLMSFDEYVGNWSVRFQYRLPYLAFAAIFTSAGCTTTVWLAQRVSQLRAHPFGGSALVALVLLLLVPTASDLGGALGIWQMPRWFAFELKVIIRLFLILLPLSALSGLAALLCRRLLPPEA